MSGVIDSRVIFAILRSFSKNITKRKIEESLIISEATARRLLYGNVGKIYWPDGETWEDDSVEYKNAKLNFEQQVVYFFDECFEKYLNSNLILAKEKIRDVFQYFGFSAEEIEQVFERHINLDLTDAKNKIKQNLIRDQRPYEEIVAVEQAGCVDEIATHVFHDIATYLTCCAQSNYLNKRPIVSLSRLKAINSAVKAESDVMSENKGELYMDHDLMEIVEHLMYQGLSGRMGREQLFALANGGNPYAAYEIGELYFHGYITRNHKPDIIKACEWYEKAQNHPGALWTLGYCILNNFYPHVPENEIDYQTALNYFKKAQSIETPFGGSPEALTSIGQMWEEGCYPAEDFAQTRHCLPSDPKKAFEYYCRADALGYHYATNRIALRHEKAGRFKEAFEYYARSAEMVDDGYVLNKLGQFFEYGKGCEKNISKACEYYVKAVEEVLEDDVTAWGLFNAGRVYACRIPNQPEKYFNLNRAFELFVEAFERIKLEEKHLVLHELLDILLAANTSSLANRELNRWKDDVRDLSEIYLREMREHSINEDSENVESIQRRMLRL